MSDGPPVPSGFLCPISEDIMRDPVVCADGHTWLTARLTFARESQVKRTRCVRAFT